MYSDSKASIFRVQLAATMFSGNLKSKELVNAVHTSTCVDICQLPDFYHCKCMERSSMYVFLGKFSEMEL